MLRISICNGDGQRAALRICSHHREPEAVNLLLIVNASRIPSTRSLPSALAFFIHVRFDL